MLLSIGVLIGLIVLLGVSKFYKVGSIEFILAIVVVMILGDFVLAWSSQRAIDQGKINLHNDFIGKTGTVIEEFIQTKNEFVGKVKINGEKWVACCDFALKEGENVVIIARNGLVLFVEKSA